MKNSILSLIIAGLSLTFLSCKKEYPKPKNTAVCELATADHPKNSAYQAVLDELTTKGFVGLSLLTETPEDGIWMGASGMASIEDDVKMTPCHLHHTASLYKTFAAVIILQLAEEGHFNLEDKASTYLPSQIIDQLPNGNDFTIEQLLSHRTGMVDVFEFDFILDFFNDPYKQYTTDELLEYVYGTKAASAVGTDFYYSDANYILLTLIINHFAGDFKTEAEQRIFNPLGMGETTLITSPDEVPSNVANSYWDKYGDDKLENNSDIQAALTAGLSGTDGIISSSTDINKFTKGIFDGSLLNSSSINQLALIREVPEIEQEKHGIMGYGLGVMQVSINNSIWQGHFGNHVGSGAIMLYNPEKQQSIVVFTNTGTFFSDHIKPTFFGELLWRISTIMDA